MNMNSYRLICPPLKHNEHEQVQMLSVKTTQTQHLVKTQNERRIDVLKNEKKKR